VVVSVYAEYSLRSDGAVAVHNYANEGSVNGIVHEANLCATVPNAGDKSQLAVGPCWLWSAFYGPYWIVAYDEREGYVIVSGGQPTIPTKDGLCSTGNGVNNSGLWIMTRAQQRDDQLLSKVRGIARAKGFDVDVLQDVVQQGCMYNS
jgi:lipocalin